MRQVIAPAKRVGKSVDQMGARMVNGDATVIRCPQHLEFRAQISRLRDGGINIGQQFTQPDQRCVIADRVGYRSGEAFQQMAERINPG